MKNKTFTWLFIMYLLFANFPGAYADEQGNRLLQKCLARMRSLNSFEAEFTIDGKMPHDEVHHKGYFKVKRPNFVLQTVVFAKNTGSLIVNSDGERLIRYITSENKYNVLKVNKDNLQLQADTEARVILYPDLIEKSVNIYGEPTVGKEVKIDGISCQRLVFGGDDVIIVYYVDETGLIHGMESKIGDMTTVEHLHHIKLNQITSNKAFDWKPPKGAKRTDDPL